MQMNLGQIVDRVGDANPQIFRELKERLTLRNLGIAIVASLLVQGFTLLYFNGQIPVAVPEVESIERLETNRPPTDNQFRVHDQIYSKYCQGSQKDARTDRCQLDSNGNFKINWRIWRSDVANCLSWIISFGTILGSVYMLVADLVREEKRGTLNFIRLSPQSAQKIFIGKILGVPILVYLAATLMLPLHVSLGLSAGGALPLFVSWYATIGATWWLFASAAVLYTILGGGQAIVTTMGTAVPLCFALGIVNNHLVEAINGIQWRTQISESWFGLPIHRSALYFDAFEIGCCLVASYWVWQALDRRYLNPTATAIGKQQSYLINLCWQLWIGGFALPLLFADPDQYWRTRQLLSCLAIADFMALLLSIALLLPSKQALQDWSRHRRERTHLGRKFWQRDLVRDLIGNDKSPALLTIAINVYEIG
jgi:ABC-type transport system involved in multi-copper enzyme maturation permease subunit